MAQINNYIENHNNILPKISKGFIHYKANTVAKQTSLVEETLVPFHVKS
jgi:hypothetical protein